MKFLTIKKYNTFAKAKIQIMISQRQLFLKHVGQTSKEPMSLEIEKAEGIYLFDVNGKKYYDMVSGVSVSNIGHRNPEVIKAIKDQLDKYMHLMVYGEYIQSPQVKLAKLLSDNLPKSLDTVFFVNSGSEAVEGALKLAKRYTNRAEIISFKKGYHGSTQGALSVLGSETLKNSYRPLLPGIKLLEYNNIENLKEITERTACVITETIQSEAGIILPENDFLKKLRERCHETGTLLIFDEVQMGFGRTGKLFSFENFDVIPDIFTIAKAMGGGMPIGAFVSSNEIMSTLTFKPALGHITTFGGHPVCCAAALANLNFILKNNIIDDVNDKGKLFVKLLSNHPKVKGIRRKGLMLAIKLENHYLLEKYINISLDNGLIHDMFLFNDDSFRIAPPLTITFDEIKEVSKIIISCLDKI